MEISASHPGAQLVAKGASKPRSGKLAERAHDQRGKRAPAEQVLEGEWLNDRRRQAADDVRQKYRRYYEQVQKAESSPRSPHAAQALKAYLATSGLHEGEYPRYLDVYA